MFLADDFFHGTLPRFFGGSPWEHWAAFPVMFSTGWPVLSLVFQGFAPCSLLCSAVLPSFMWPSGTRSNMAPGRLSTERATVGLQNAQASSALTLSGSMATPSSHSPTLPLSLSHFRIWCQPFSGLGFFQVGIRHQFTVFLLSSPDIKGEVPSTPLRGVGERITAQFSASKFCYKFFSFFHNFLLLYF